MLVQTGNIVYRINRAHGLHSGGKEEGADAVEGNQCDESKDTICSVCLREKTKKLQRRKPGIEPKNVNDVPGLKRKQCPACTLVGIPYES